MDTTARTTPAPEQALLCRDCGEAQGWGFLVYPLSEMPGPLYECPRCRDCFAGQRRCPLCGLFARRLGDYACPEQCDSPEMAHRVEVRAVYRCPLCVARADERQCFDADQIADHLASHEVEA